MELIESAKLAFANTFAFYLKAHNYHWNVTGPLFFNFHKLFGSIYEEVYSSIDPFAEHIRTINSFVPGSFIRFQELSEIVDETSVPDHNTMVRRLIDDNKKLIDSLEKLRQIATDKGEYGIAKFSEDRIEAQKKHQWMLSSSLVITK